jgi:ABC-type multidrug transport system ATPase subunit
MIKRIKINSFKYEDKDDFIFNLNREIKNKNCFLIGSNGSGKSTLLKLILGLIEGKCSIQIEEKYNLNNSEQRYGYAINNIFYVPDNVFFENEFMKVKHFLEFKNIKIRDIVAKELDEILLKDLSHGNRKKLYLLEAFSSEKTILLFDEATNGLDTKSKEKVIEYINKTPKQIIFATHDMDIVQKVANKELIHVEHQN